MINVSDPMNITIPSRSADIKDTNAQVAPAHKDGKTNDLKTRNNSMKEPSPGKLGMIGDGRQK